MLVWGFEENLSSDLTTVLGTKLKFARGIFVRDKFRSLDQNFEDGVLLMSFDEKQMRNTLHFILVSTHVTDQQILHKIKKRTLKTIYVYIVVKF